MADTTQVKEITEKLEQGVKDLFNSETYADYLKTMSRFHNYSTRNTLLIHLQKPDATLVAGFQAWQNKFERHVKKGEKSIKIFAPVPFTKREEKEVIDPLTRMPVIGEDGKPVIEYTEHKIARFKVTSVFDVSQTEGKPLPELAQDLTGNVEQYEAFTDALRAVSPLPIVFEAMPENTDGVCRFGSEIAIREGMSEIQTVSAIIHEITHAKLHDLESLRLMDENAQAKDRRTEEVEAESVSYCVNSFFSVDTGANAFGYIANWSKGRELKELNASLDTIRKASAELIDAIEGKFREIAKERDITFAIGGEQLEIAGEEMSQEETMSALAPGRPTPGSVYARYSNLIADLAGDDEAYANAVLNSDEQNARTECEAAVRRVIMSLFSESDAHIELYRHYTENPDFKGRLEDFVFMRTYLESQTAQRESESETSAPAADVSALIASYARNAEVSAPLRVGSVVLMTPVFDDMNFNRTGKRIRVTVEEPAGKYQLFSRDENGDKALYVLTASGMIDHTARYFPNEWDDKLNKRVGAVPTEAQLDALLPQIASQFEADMANPTKWALYQHAAVLNRIDECDKHNEPVRELRREESERRREAGEKARLEEQRQKDERYNARVDEIAKAIENGATIGVGYDQYAFDGKNPVLDLFSLYGVDLPLRTKGWVNTGLAELTDGSYRYYKSKHKGDSSTFMGYLRKLREEIHATPIEQKRQYAAADTEVKSTVENKLYQKFADMFPQFANGEYSHLRLESEGFEPLSLEWIFGDRISVMHSYVLNGDLCYDPMMEFHFDNIGKTMLPCRFEQSIPPVCQYFDDDGVGRSIGASGELHTLTTLQSRLNSFADQWLSNIAEQGFMPVRGTIERDGEDIRITFDEQGNPIMPDAEPEKTYDLGYGFLGNGITVWNRAEEQNGDYVTVAHIAPDRSVTFYDKDMPHDVKQRIDTVANSPETWASGFARAPENVPPHIDGSPTPASVYEDVKRILPETASAKAVDPSLPDPAIGQAEMNQYGYTESDMYPLTADKAVELFDADHTIYLLYPDNTEAVAVDRDEIITFSGDGLCGITQADWELSPVRAAQIAAAANIESSRESDLLYGDGNKFGIYQIRDDIDEPHNFRFAPLREMEALGLAVNRANYELVYTAPLTARIEFLSDRYPALNKIYEDFNVNRPADYAGRSLSVSDVVVLKYNGDIASFYVDSIGFKELDAFIGDETQWADALKREQERNGVIPVSGQDSLSQVGTSLAEYSGKSTAELESDAKSGKVVSLFELSQAVKAERGNGSSRREIPKAKKPTLMERLAEGKRKAAAQGAQKPVPQRDSDKEARERQVSPPYQNASRTASGKPRCTKDPTSSKNQKNGRKYDESGNIHRRGRKSHMRF